MPNKEINYLIKPNKKLDQIIFQYAVLDINNLKMYFNYENELTNFFKNVINQLKSKNIIFIYPEVWEIGFVTQESVEYNEDTFDTFFRLSLRNDLQNYFETEDLIGVGQYAEDQSFYFTTKIPIDTSFVDPEYFEVTCEITEVEE